MHFDFLILIYFCGNTFAFVINNFVIKRLYFLDIPFILLANAYIFLLK